MRRRNFRFDSATFVAVTITLIMVACAGPPVRSSSNFRGRFTVAILAFKDQNNSSVAETEGLGLEIVDRISAELVDLPDLDLVDRESLIKVLEELRLSSSDLVQPETRAQLGKLLGADYLVMGGYMTNGSDLQLTARIIKVERGVVEGGVIKSGAISAREEIAESLSKEVASKLISKSGCRAKKNPVSSFEHLCKGISYEKKNNFTEALKHYKKAVRLDPKNQIAHDRMEALLLGETE